MVIPVNTDAPTWAQDFARNVDEAIQQALRQPVQLPSHTVATLPSASRWNNCSIIVSDETGGRTIATSDGTNWRRVSDGNVVS